MQMKLPLAQFLCACTLAVSASAMADVRVEIDALRDCIDTDTVTGGKATVSLAPGRYVASLTHNSMLCNAGSQAPSCRIDKVILQTRANAPAPKPVFWGLVVQDPVVLDISGTTNTDVYAFVLDPNCSDNVGTATLRLQPVQ
jgi:hypothetical protein